MYHGFGLLIFYQVICIYAYIGLDLFCFLVISFFFFLVISLSAFDIKVALFYKLSYGIIFF